MFMANLNHRNLLTFIHLLIFTRLLIFLYILIPTPAIADTPSIVIPESIINDNTTPNYYPVELLKLALQKTEATDGKVALKSYPLVIGRNRARAILINKLGIDVMWSSSTRQRQQQLLPIKFNLYKGISEYKILLIRQEDQGKFSNVKTAADLRKFMAGTGTHWQDKQVLAFNRMPLVTSWDYEHLFKMLTAKRFDYIMRSSQEIWNELSRHPRLPLMAEQTLLIHYKQPLYYFVQKENTLLADRILRGLNLAEADGSLTTLLNDLPGFKMAVQEISNQQRKIIELENPE